MPIRNDAREAAHLVDRLERLTRSGEAGPDLNPAQWEALRYLDRANRFSRTPAALAAYLGSTRGTVSQTLIALEGKGLVARRPSARDGRSVEVQLTASGRAALAGDPLLTLAGYIDAAAGDGLPRFVEMLRDVLRTAIARNGARAFGACRTCRYFRADVRTDDPLPHRCGLIDEPLSEADSRAICVEQVA